MVLTITLYKIAKELRLKREQTYHVTSEHKRVRSNKSLYPREVRKRYAYFDDDFDDKFEF